MRPVSVAKTPLEEKCSLDARRSISRTPRGAAVAVRGRTPDILMSLTPSSPARPLRSGPLAVRLQPCTSEESQRLRGLLLGTRNIIRRHHRLDHRERLHVHRRNSRCRHGTHRHGVQDGQRLRTVDPNRLTPARLDIDRLLCPPAHPSHRAEPLQPPATRLRRTVAARHSR